jgi:HEAT repeat protein
MTAAIFLTVFFAAHDDARPIIDSYLGSIDTPIGADRWRALGPAAIPTLAAISRDRGQLPSRRARALEGLALAGGDAAAPVLVEVLARADEPPAVRAGALRGVGVVLDGARLVAVVAPVMDGAADPHVRAAAAEVLATRAPREGCAPVRDRAARERPEWRLAYARALRACGD